MRWRRDGEFVVNIASKAPEVLKSFASSNSKRGRKCGQSRTWWFWTYRRRYICLERKAPESYWLMRAPGQYEAFEIDNSLKASGLATDVVDMNRCNRNPENPIEHKTRKGDVMYPALLDQRRTKGNAATARRPPGSPCRRQPIRSLRAPQKPKCNLNGQKQRKARYHSSGRVTAQTA